MEFFHRVCPFCHDPECTPLVPAVDLSGSMGGKCFAVRCRHCGFVYTNPAPTASALKSLYNKFHHAWLEVAGHNNPLTKFDITVPSSRRYAQIKYQASHARGRLLDVGCGSGNYLRIMTDRGWDAIGVEKYSAAIRSQDNLQIVIGDFESIEFKPESFDVVAMFHFLEHTSDPVVALEKTLRILRPGGRLIVESPNVASLGFFLFGAYWNGWQLPFHLNHFSPSTFLKMALAHGFTKGKWVSLCSPGDSAAAIRRALRRTQGELNVDRGGRLDASSPVVLFAALIAISLFPLQVIATFFGSGYSFLAEVTKPSGT